MVDVNKKEKETIAKSNKAYADKVAKSNKAYADKVAKANEAYRQKMIKEDPVKYERIMKEAHKKLQKQFLTRTVKKRYVALLNGLVNDTNGEISLPLRVDLDDRPRQLVCYQHGKPAITKWEIKKKIGDKTKVYFYPITGRTHQLRVHASHPKGLNTPIVGDDLYGIKKDRLHLHAESITFVHPFTKEELTFTVKEEF